MTETEKKRSIETYAKWSADQQGARLPDNWLDSLIDLLEKKHFWSVWRSPFALGGVIDGWVAGFKADPKST